ncbi:MAG TPA: phytanoyl-CoA dioxygenase family protein [Candidatus Paceibacterota bacterium]
MKGKLSKKQIKQYREEGYLNIPGFYDLKKEILPIQRDIHRLIGLIIKAQELGIKQEKFNPLTFDSGLNDILHGHRELASVIYEAVKKLPSYVSLLTSKKHLDAAGAFLGSEFVGLANRGYGVRMDHPTEDKYLTLWHQDYITQLCAKSGVVFWSPLRAVTMDMGPVEFCPRSHRSGIFPVVCDGKGANAIKIKDEQKLVNKFKEKLQVEMKVGDMIAMDYLLLHRSIPNRGKYTRWGMIERYFDFLDETGIGYGWKGGLQEGTSFGTVHPDLYEEVKKV